MNEHDSPERRAKHTPGPWEADGVDIVEASGKDRAYVATALYNFLPPMTKANARLISAAPDLLAALENVHSLRICWPKETEEAAVNAIRKAKGE